jgi:hypothetical protein
MAKQENVVRAVKKFAGGSFEYYSDASKQRMSRRVTISVDTERGTSNVNLSIREAQVFKNFLEKYIGDNAEAKNEVAVEAVAPQPVAE